MDNLTDNQFKQLYNNWIDQNDLIVKVCDPRGKPGSLAFYLQFTNSEDYNKTKNYFLKKNVVLLQCSVKPTRLQIYQYRNSLM